MKPAYSDISSTYQIDFSVKSSGKRISLTKRRVQWRFGFANPQAVEEGKASIDCRGEEHEISLIWSASSGKRAIFFNGEEIHNSKGRNKLEHTWGWRSCHSFKVVAHGPAVSPKNGFKRYDLFLDGRSYFDFLKLYQLGRTTEKGTFKKGEVCADDHHGSVQNDFGQSSSSLYNPSLFGGEFFPDASIHEESKSFVMEQSVNTLNPTNNSKAFDLLTEITADIKAGSKSSCDTFAGTRNGQQERKELKDQFSYHNPIALSEVYQYPEACAEPKSPECPLNGATVKGINDEKALPVTMTGRIQRETCNTTDENRSLFVNPSEGVTDVVPYDVTVNLHVAPAEDISSDVDKAMQKLVNLEDLISLSTIQKCDRRNGAKNHSGAILPIDAPWYSNQTLQEIQVYKATISQKKTVIKPLTYAECHTRVPQNTSTDNDLHLTKNCSSGYSLGQETCYAYPENAVLFTGQ